MSTPEKGNGPARDGAVRGAARPASTLRATTDMPIALSVCIAELAEHLGIEVTR